MTQLDIHEAGERLADLIARARAGEEVIISENGKPVARLGPVEATDSNLSSLPDWKAAMMQAAGTWKDRDDIPELMEQLRHEWNRVEPPDEPL
jgi:prevent-host-death family protein